MRWSALLAGVMALAGAAARGADSPYVIWANEDVAHIITDEERVAFDKLGTDLEREKFIEQFWLRRDPTPGTALNEYKEEHYRRIAYANKKFATIARAGWRTDRGSVYIRFGPPDEIETHPPGTRSKYGAENWLYRHIDGLGDNLVIAFTDLTGSGDYRVAPGKGR